MSISPNMEFFNISGIEGLLGRSEIAGKIMHDETSNNSSDGHLYPFIELNSFDSNNSESFPLLNSLTKTKCSSRKMGMQLGCF
ncbi:hypothetical protein [Cryptosporidium hominis TU502]|uniref:hypothetical protein n=1 Tax=Cryptosporidium hominis (strain TU502) TaxID=353151 RepID=UPI0000453061|nr:hypothetical protein [Cryptosporidium hominis TU502]